jgi:hypothetical protein
MGAAMGAVMGAAVGASVALLKLPGSRNFDPLTGESAQRCSLSVEAAVLLLQ